MNEVQLRRCSSSPTSALVSPVTAPCQAFTLFLIHGASQMTNLVCARFLSVAGSSVLSLQVRLVGMRFLRWY